MIEVTVTEDGQVALDIEFEGISRRAILTPDQSNTLQMDLYNVLWEEGGLLIKEDTTIKDYDYETEGLGGT